MAFCDSMYTFRKFILADGGIRTLNRGLPDKDGFCNYLPVKKENTYCEKKEKGTRVIELLMTFSFELN
ncbi:hypothetical protein LB506_000909 [Fusarium annulatum]|nr:hypothetical protein LB506_000909 [Fusarium annulatum]